MNIGPSSMLPLSDLGYVTDPVRTGGINEKGYNPEDTTAAGLKKTGKTECQTCKSRKYKDGSNEMVSFKSAAHISPESSGAKVRAHEQEHVSNAYSKAAQKNGKVLQASVSIHTSVCPECGRTYVSGGTTNTKIAFNKEDPYGRNASKYYEEALKGNNIDIAC